MFDRLIISSTDDHFIQFLPIVCKAWRNLFPDLKISLSFVTKRNENDNFIRRIQSYCDTHLYPLVDNIAESNLSLVARYHLAAKFPDEVCSIEDIDTIPLNKKWLIEKVDQRPKGKILRVGSEVYKGTKHEGKFPTSTISAEGYLFKELTNPKNLRWEELIRSWLDIEIIDKKEKISNPKGIFCDESLIRALCIKYKMQNKIHEIPRGVDIKNDWIDRSWWKIDKEKLNRDGYIMCNFLRPYDSNFEFIIPVIEKVFGENYQSQEVILKGNI